MWARGRGGLWGRRRAAAASFTANAVNFDGTNDLLNRGAGLTGAADGGGITISMWVRFASLTSPRYIFKHGDNRITFQVYTDNAVQFEVNSTGGGLLGQVQSGSLATNTWYHFLFSYDPATGNVTCYRNDANVSPGTETAGTPDWTSTDWIIGAFNTSGTFRFSGDLAEVWVEDTFIDFATESNRRLFISATGKPVDLGADGSTPTGSSPLIYLSGATASWHTNDGTGGGFTVTGALSTASTSPSD